MYDTRSEERKEIFSGDPKDIGSKMAAYMRKYFYVREINFDDFPRKDIVDEFDGTLPLYNRDGAVPSYSNRLSGDTNRKSLEL